MAESIREVIARMKSNQQNSQTQQNKPSINQKPEKAEVLDEEDEYDEEEDDEIPAKVEKQDVKPKETENIDPQVGTEQQIAMEIELLQNDGRFRAELLHQLQEINKALVVVAGTLVDLTKNGKA